jgi:predicted transcriptional regulator
MLLEIDKEILSFLNERGRRFTDIRKLLGVNKMRIARRLKALAERGLVFKDKKTGLWRKTNPLDIYKKFPETALEDVASWLIRLSMRSALVELYIVHVGLAD